MTRHVLRRVTRLFAATAATLAALPALAVAGSYEQVDRVTGAQGWSGFTQTVNPVAASDSGRVAVLESAPYEGPARPYSPTTYARDIVTNTTTVLAKVGERLVGFSANETKALVLVQQSTGGSSVVVRPTSGGADRPVGTFSRDEFITAALSGDGNTVVVASSAGSISVFDLRLGTRRSYPVADPTVSPRSISDNGKVITGASGTEAGFSLIAGKLSKLGRPTLISPNGAIAVATTRSGSFIAPTAISAYRLADGVSRSYPIPAPRAGAIAWISPDGLRVVFSPGDVIPTDAAQVLDLTTGRWSDVAAPYGNELLGLDLFNPSLPFGAISRNGRYATIAYGGGFLSDHAALVNLTGADLPGDQEALSASSFMEIDPPAPICGQPGFMNVRLRRPGAWAPVPRQSDVLITADGAELLRTTLVFPTDPNGTNPEEFLTVPAGAQRLSVRATVTTADGQVRTTSETVAVRCLQLATE